MTAANPAVQPTASQQAAVEAALVLLERMGLTPADLAAVPQPRTPVPTFADYVPVVAAAVSAGTRRAYGSYWNRVLDQWGDRRLDGPTPSEIRQLMAYVKTHVVARRNAGPPSPRAVREAACRRSTWARPPTGQTGAIVAVDLARRAQRRCVAYATRTLSPSRPTAAGAGAGVRRPVPCSSRAP